MPYYVFAIGGTGARCLESLLYLCAMGRGPEKLHPIIVDPDSGNGNLNRTKELLINYKDIRDKIINPTPGSLFYTDVIYKETDLGPDILDDMPNYYNPNEGLTEGKNTLSHFIGYNTELAETDARYLAELFYGNDEMDMDMKQGYRGIPSIGSILMTNIQDANIWKVITSRLIADPNSKVFIFASVFGGTGASGYPVISKLIKNQAPKARVGGALLLPYFRLPDPQNLIEHREALKKEKVLPNSNSFMLNSKAACEFYKHDYAGTDSNYILGDDWDLCDEYKNYEIGSSKQKNDAHMIELFAAYAAMDFWDKQGNNYQKFYHIQVKNPEDGDNKSEIELTDIPKAEISTTAESEYLFERFALLYHYIHDLNQLVIKNNFGMLNQIAWIRKNKMNGKEILENKMEIERIASFLSTFKEWIRQNHSNAAALSIMDISLSLDRLLSSNPNKHKKTNINKLDVHLYRNSEKRESFTDSFIKAASKGKLRIKGRI